MAFLLLCGVGGVLSAGMLVPLAAGANTATDSVQEIFNKLPDELTPEPPSEASTILYSDGSPMATIYAQNRIIKPLDEISLVMQQAVVATEDKRFYKHGAVDFEGISRAAVKTLNGKQEGASTLTQQYVKNVLIDRAVRENKPIDIYDAKENSLARKAREAKLAIALEENMTKDEILEGYLNIAQFGRSVYGVETASQQYFGIPAADLSYLQAATIAGITKEPSRYDPSKPENQEDSQNRRDTVLELMLKEDVITQEEYDTGIATPLVDTLNLHTSDATCVAAENAEHFCDYVISSIKMNPAFGETEKDRMDLLYNGGLTITTTLDHGMQEAAMRRAREAIPVDDESGLEDVIVSVEPGTGYIRAMAQNRPYTTDQNVPRTEATAINYAADQAHGGSRGFSPGSTWKPFLLAEWLKQPGKSLYSSVNADKRPFGAVFHSSCGGELGSNRSPWNLANADGSTDAGNITVLHATAKSINTAYVTMETQLDLCAVRNTAWDIGVRPAISKEIVHDELGNPTAESIAIRPTMVIGTQNSAPLDMAAAFGTFASAGTYCEPLAIQSATDTDGNPFDIQPKCNPNALDPGVANTVTQALQAVIAPGGGAPKAALAGRPAAGKTGTAQNNTHNWFVGYTPQLVTAVWIGNGEEDRKMQGIRINGRYERYWYGSSLAAPTWKGYMDEVLAPYPAVGFGAPDPGRVGSPAPKPSTPQTDGNEG